MLCLFEDRHADRFNPVALTRHVSELLVGASTLQDRAKRVTGRSGLILHGRPHIRDFCRLRGDAVRPDSTHTDPILFLNARLPLTAELFGRLPRGRNWVVSSGEEIVAALLGPEVTARVDWESDRLDLFNLDGITIVDADIPMPEYIWDLLGLNGAMIELDAAESPASSQIPSFPGVHLVSPERITLGDGSRLKPGVVIDASRGAVIIGRNVEIMANAVVEGPCAIGDNSVVKIGAKIYGHTSIGPWCKIGGEVENSIVLGYSNKQHDGFLGHSYLGRWVNLGADTNTSDLKNNYGAIRVVQNGAQIDTGRIFLGSLIGDHSKTGINTMLNTGTVIGVAANIFGGGFPPKEIPSFSWGGSEGFERFDLEKGLDLARRVMARRSVPFTAADEHLLRYIAASHAAPAFSIPQQRL